MEGDVVNLIINNIPFYFSDEVRPRIRESLKIKALFLLDGKTIIQEPDDGRLLRPDL
jgi:hypothetical protein